MSWITVKGGYQIQCDRCGFTRGSLFKSDNPRPKRFEHSQVPFREKRKPAGWRQWLEDDTESHLCPDCAAHG